MGLWQELKIYIGWDQLNPNSIRALFLIIFFVILAFIISFLIINSADTRILQITLDSRLHTSASTLPTVLPVNYQDQALQTQEISLAEQELVNNKLDRLVLATSLDDLKTLILRDGVFYLTAYSTYLYRETKQDRSFLSAESAPQFYQDVLRTGKSSYGIIQTPQGKFYEIAIFCRSEGGQPYLSVASIRYDKLTKLMFTHTSIRMLNYFLLALLVIFLFYMGLRVTIVFTKQINQLDRLKGQLYLKAQRDDLTGLLRRDTFFDMIYDYFKHKTGSHLGYVLLIVDIDNLKLINEQYGHFFGDEIIRLISRFCLKARSQSDLVCRYGGEEFLIFLADISLHDAKNVAERLRNWVETANILTSQNIRVPVTVTIGGLWFSEAPVILADYIYLADVQLLQGKKEGKNRVILSIK